MSYWKLQTRYLDQGDDEGAWTYVNWETGHQVGAPEFASVFTDYERIEAEGKLAVHPENAGMEWRWLEVGVKDREQT